VCFEEFPNVILSDSTLDALFEPYYGKMGVASGAFIVESFIIGSLIPQGIDPRGMPPLDLDLKQGIRNCVESTIQPGYHKEITWVHTQYITRQLS